jgi:signal transduction histidine kinase
MDVVPLDLAPFIESVVRRFQSKYAAHMGDEESVENVVTPLVGVRGGARGDVTVTLDLPPNLPTVMADRERIEEVLQNLLDNAVKYSPRQRNLIVACRATGDEVIVSVSDMGMGISLREQEHIFDRFHRIGNRLTQTTPGAGLGLYICRAIVEAHGGHIWVESTLHEGSTFSFSLPRVEKANLPMVVFN